MDTSIELIEEIIQTQGSRVSTIVVISIQMKHSLSVDAQQTRDDALGQSSPQDDSIVLAISEGITAVGQPVEVELLLLGHGKQVSGDEDVLGL